jgi:hypothetical protein
LRTVQEASEPMFAVWMSRLAALIGVASILVQAWYATHGLNYYIFGAGCLLFAVWLPLVGWVIAKRGGKALWHLWIAMPLLLETTLLGFLTIAILFFGGG